MLTDMLQNQRHFISKSYVLVCYDNGPLMVTVRFIKVNVLPQLDQGTKQISGPGNSVGIATGYGLDGPGIEFRWGEIFRRPDRALEHSQPPVQWIPGLSRGRKRPGRDAEKSPLLVRRSENTVELYLYST